MSSPGRKLVLITEIIAPYRIPVFNALARMDHIDLHVIFLAETDPTQRQWMVYKSEIQFSYEVLPSWRRRIAGYSILLNRGLLQSLDRAHPEVIVCGGYNYPASWQALRWSLRNGVPFLVWVESTASDRRNQHRLIEFLKHQFLSKCQGFIVPGKASAEYVRKFGAAERSIVKAPDAVDTEFFAQQAALARKNEDHWRKSLDLPQHYFLFVGRLIEAKGVFDLLQAYIDLPESTRSAVGLVFAGDGSARGELERRSAGLAPGNVKFPGFVQREQLAQYYALSDLFIFPTYSDPWGLVVNEAMACSLPVICSSAAGCAADLIEDGWNGSFVTAGDAAALKTAMLRLAQDTDLRTQMGQHSWERIQNYSPAACAAGIATAAQSVAGARP